ncbi:MAG: sensor histidine kinase, partial [Desulfobulbaceae bacterium]|nr:sensor histidine kinase [Desulfobulbaceae bacterium]
TNSFKYAFAEKEQGEIMIAFHNVGEKELCLEVRDNGVGLETPAEEAPPTLGLSLIESLVGQLDGRYTFGNDNGTSCRILFPNPTG